jgi:hypothetical protein
MVVNEELLQRVVKRLRAKPEQWDQDGWVILSEDDVCEVFTRGRPYGDRNVIIGDFALMEGFCGTKACLAGHTVLEAGDEIMIWDSDPETGTFECIDDKGNVHNIEIRAQELLGLTRDQADVLFAPHSDSLRVPDISRDLDQFITTISVVTGVTFD